MVRVLIIDDDEDEYVLVRDFLSRSPLFTYAIEWASSYPEGVLLLQTGQHDVCLLGCQFAGSTVLELLASASRSGGRVPVIVLSAQGDHAHDVELMRAGAADYLVRGQFSDRQLERALRYTVEHARARQQLRESQHQLKHLSAQLLASQESERALMAQRIHDSVGQALAGIKFGAEQAAAQLQTDRHAAGQSLDRIVRLVQQACDEVRGIQKDLRPPTLDDLGVLDTLRHFLHDFGEVYSHIQVEAELGVTEAEIPAALKTALYRIVQEAFQNVARHSRARRVELALRRRRKYLELRISDNGAGFDLELAHARGRGMGLASMRERAELSGGRLVCSSTLGRGTVLRGRWGLDSLAILRCSPING